MSENLIYCPAAVLFMLQKGRVLKILRGIESLTYIKSHDSVTRNNKMTGNDPNLDLVNINAYTKCGEIMSISSSVIERKQNSDKNQGPKISQI